MGRKKICKENKFFKRFQKRCLEVFKAHHWQGNIRELRSVVERHLVKNETDLIQESDLDVSLFEKSSQVNPVTMQEIDEHTEGIKRQLVIKAINDSGSQAEASRRLGIAQNCLHYFLAKWGIVNG